MLHQPPPIQWLPAFEAAARLLNFKQAAAELCVSAPAISQQIKVLEAYLGVNLFDRSTRKLRLTEAGESYFHSAREIIQKHHKSYREFERTYRYPTLKVSAPLFIAQELLIPHYNAFKEFAPEINLRLNTGHNLVDFESEPIDAALRFGRGNWPELECRLVSRVEPRLVCSRAYLNRTGLTENTFLTKERLEQQTLISVYEDLKDWTGSYPGIKPANKMICDSYYMAFRAAEEGLGIAVGLRPVINRHIRDGRLIMLDTDPLTTDFAYWLVAPPNRARSENIDTLYRWIKSLFATL
jgi:LysR family glycine cleavage system transcriptional activator